MAGLESPTLVFANTTSSWLALPSWPISLNVTRYAPLLEDLVWAGPRIVRKLGAYVSHSDTLDTGRLILDPDTSRHIHDIMEPLTADPSSSAAASSRLSIDGTRGLGSVFGYATSKWALCCVAMAVVLNRTHIFAATRRRLRLRWPSRLLLRILPIILLAMQARRILQSMQCQTSPHFSLLRWGDPDKASDLMFSHPNHILHTLSSALLFFSSDEESCLAVRMVPDETGSARNLSGSLSLLWPLFGSLCLSQFFETVSCAVQGRSVAHETGMTLFEQSLAFAEAEAAISNQLGWGVFTKSQPTDAPASAVGSAIALSRSMILKRVNTPPEVLLVAFLSAMTHITSHVLGVFGLQAKLRLVSTGFWGLCFMGSIVWSAFVFDMDDPSSQGLLRFPTVCIVGFVPHVLVLVGIIVCLFIYGFAMLLSAFIPPRQQDTPPMTFRDRLARAHENMQANVSLSEIRITREMDFYTALLRTGFGAITMASEAVYLNEDRGINLKRRTWLEEERFREFDEMQRKWISGGLPGSQYDHIGAIGLIPIKGGSTIAPNGFARERAAQNIPKGRAERSARVGIGAAERSSRWLMALEFLLSINKLIARVGAKAILWCLDFLRIRYRPGWLLSLARHPKSSKPQSKASSRTDGQTRRGLASGSDNSGRIPRAESTDIEAEFRRVDGDLDEAKLESDLYTYWLKGGWWGSNDSSGDFELQSDEDDFDTTSVISMSTNGGRSDDEMDGWEDDEEDGQRTPTQSRRRDSTPFVDSPMQMSDLARLLHPTNQEEREEARTLSAHLQTDGIMTRSRYHRMEQLQRSRVLTAPTSGLLHPDIAPRAPPTGQGSTKLSPDEEERLLEQLILSRRQPSPAAASSWEDGGAGFGSSGPQCVVCQSTPRTIIVWPCRCLSLCDDCRVSLAMNNFDKCVCCRREVVSFSRIFVP